MKSYEEMAERVLVRAEKEKQNCKRRNRIVLATVAGMFCLCLSVLSVLWTRVPEPQASEQSVHREPRIGFVVRCSASEVKPAELIKDVVVPCESLIRVRDVTGMDEKERYVVRSEEKALAKELFANWDENKSFTQWGSDTAIISLFCVGDLGLVIDDYNDVESKYITATKMGSASLGHVDYYEGDDKITVFWGPSDIAIKQIEKNPETKLSGLSHTLTVTVEFKDGTTETATIDMIVDDDGYVYAVQRGITVTA